VNKIPIGIREAKMVKYSIPAKSISLKDNKAILGENIELYGICRGVYHIQTAANGKYQGLLETAQEFIEFRGIMGTAKSFRGRRFIEEENSLELCIAKASSETGKEVTMRGNWNGEYLQVHGLRLEPDEIQTGSFNN
jgi:hypothetical protein